MHFMPSIAYVAKALYSVGAETEWDDASPEEQSTHMQLARVALDAIWSWQKTFRPTSRYCFEPASITTEPGELNGWTIHDRTLGMTTILGMIYDPLLAERICEDLNRRDAEKKQTIPAVE